PELRVPAGFGNRPDVDEAPHAVRAEDVDELLDRVGRVPDGENSRRGSHTSRYNYPVEHGRLNGRGQCLHLTRNRVRFRRFSVVLLAEDRAEVRIDVRPVLEEAFANLRDGDGVRLPEESFVELLADLVGEHLAVQDAGLTAVVVILALGVGRAIELAVGRPSSLRSGGRIRVQTPR